MGCNYFRYLNAPAGELTVETAPGFDGANPAAAVRSPPPDDGLWPSYNKTLTSDRFSALNQINREQRRPAEGALHLRHGQYTGFNSGLLEVDGALIFTTEYDIFSIDPATCRENWRVHEDYQPATPQGVNRGAAYLDGTLFRGTQDGRVLAYDFKTGKRLWATTIADPKKGESAPAAPIAWNGLVFVGNAGGDVKGVKGRMYALDAKTGKIVWEFYLVPKAPGDLDARPGGASRRSTPRPGKSRPGSPITGGATWTSYTLDPTTGLLYVPGGNPAPDFAPGPREGANLYTGSVVVLDAKTGAYKTISRSCRWTGTTGMFPTAPAIIETAAARSCCSVAPKDGHLYGFDLATSALLYREPVTRVENADETFSAGNAVHFCPGSVGGAEWNGPAYDPADQSRPGRRSRLVHDGDAAIAGTVRTRPSSGTPWSGEASLNPFNTWGKPDPFRRLGAAGSMRATPTPAPGDGGPRPTTRSRAASRRPPAASCSSATWAAISMRSTPLTAGNYGARRSAARLAAA